MIKWEHVTKSYTWGNGEKFTILNDVSFEINKHEFISLFGRSGSGKSTAMYLLGLLDTINSGKYFLDGMDVSKFDVASKAATRNQTLGFVFQQYVLLPNNSVAENVALPLKYSNKYSVEQHEVLVERALEQVGMLEYYNSLPKQLSGGQQQRIAIARAIVCEPKILLADEPTGSLDLETGNQIMRLFHNINTNLGTTIIMVTHDMSLAKQSHRQIEVKNGKII